VLLISYASRILQDHVIRQQCDIAQVLTHVPIDGRYTNKITSVVISVVDVTVQDDSVA